MVEKWLTLSNYLFLIPSILNHDLYLSFFFYNKPKLNGRQSVYGNNMDGSQSRSLPWVLISLERQLLGRSEIIECKCG